MAPMAPHPTRQMEPPPPPPAARDDAYAGYDDRTGDDDRYDYDYEERGSRRDDRRPGRSRSRGQLLAGVVLVLALIVSVLLGVLTYQSLVSVDLISADPFASVAGWTSMLGAVALGALGVFLLAVIALVVARPKALAGIGLFASVLLPVAAVVVGVWYGGDVLRQNVQNDIQAESADAARAFAEELGRNVPDIGPLRDLVRGLAEQSG